MTLEELVARAEITDCLYRYCRGVDRGDVELIRSVYHPDATDDHGVWKGAGFDFAPYIVNDMNQVALLGQHHLTNIMIELHGNIAAVECYYVAYHPLLDDSGQNEHVLFGGRYLDRFEHRDSNWKIAERTVLIDFARPLGPLPLWAGDEMFKPSGRGDNDSSAAFYAAIRTEAAARP